MHRSALSASFDAAADSPQKNLPADSYVIYQDLPHDDADSSSDDDADCPAEQDTLTILNINLSNSRSADTLKGAPVPAVEPAKPRPSAPKLDKIDTSRSTLNHRKHRATHSASSASSAGAPHHHYFHLNLPPCSPASPQSLSPHSSARSPSPRRKPTHRPMSSIGSTLSSGSSGSVAPGKFVFPPPSLSAPTIPVSEPELELDYSLCFSPTLSDEGGASPYIHQAQNDLQGIFNTLAHKERRLLEAREQLLAAEKDLSQFKSQWDTVLGPDSAEASPPEDESPETPVVEVPVPLSPPTPVAPMASVAPAAPESHHRMYNNLKKTSSTTSVPDVSMHSRRMLSMRHSIGHASELGFELPNAAAAAAAPDLLEIKDGSSSSSTTFLGNFSYYFREKLNGLFEQQQQQQYQIETEKRLQAKNSVTSLQSAASFHTLSPTTSLSSLSSLNDSATTHITTTTTNTTTIGGTSDSFIGRFLVNPVSAVDHHSTLFPKSSLTVRSPYLGASMLGSPPSDPFFFASGPTSTPKTPGDPLRSPFGVRHT